MSCGVMTDLRPLRVRRRLLLIVPSCFSPATATAKHASTCLISRGEHLLACFLSGGRYLISGESRCQQENVEKNYTY